MVALSCTGCRAGPQDLDDPGAQPRSLAGASSAETTKALNSTDVTPTRDDRSDVLAPEPSWKSHIEYCDRGFRSTGDVRVDLTRLGALCGPSNGLSREWGSSVVVPLTGVPIGQVLRGATSAAGCGRLAVGFVAPGAGELVVRSMRAGTSDADECRLSQSGFCPPDALTCDRSALSVQWVAAAQAENEPSETLTMSMEWWALPRALPSPPVGVPTTTRAAPSASGN